MRVASSGTGGGGRDHQGNPCAFTLIELMVIVAVIALVSCTLLPAVSMARVKVESHSCMNNLKYLGTAFSMYVSDNIDQMPYASLRMGPGEEISWDDLIDSYMGGTLDRQEKLAGPYAGFKGMVYLRCPSDKTTLPNLDSMAEPVHRRSYAMPRYLYDGESAAWPPRHTSKGGVGVVWDTDTVSGMRFVAGAEPLPMDGRHKLVPGMWAVKGNVIENPAETILLTGRLSAGNLMGSADGAFIDNAGQHFPDETGKGRRHIHKYGNNYLMVDGQVERLPALKTVGPVGSLASQSGMWTITTED